MSSASELPLEVTAAEAGHTDALLALFERTSTPCHCQYWHFTGDKNAWLERLFHASFLPGSIYLITRMPSDPQASDIVPIAVISLVLAFVATLYPSWRASRVQPAQALRYE